MNTREAAARLGVSERTIHRWVAKGRIKPRRDYFGGGADFVYVFTIGILQDAENVGPW